MKVKIPKYKEIELRDYIYLIANGGIFVFNKETSQPEKLKDGKNVCLPEKFYIHLLSMPIKQSKTPIGIWITPKTKG